MPSKQFARGLFAGFGTVENPFQVPNGMEENLRAIDDHIGPYTLEAPAAPDDPYPSGVEAGAGQIYTDGTYAVFNDGAWKRYPALAGISFTQLDGPVWTNTGSSWRVADAIATVDSVHAIRALDAATQSIDVLGSQQAGDYGGGFYIRKYEVAPAGFDNGGTQVTTSSGRGYLLRDGEAISASIFVGELADGETDNHAEYQNAIDWVYGQGGGVVFIPPYRRSRLRDSLDILPGVTLGAHVAGVGSPGTNVSTPYAAMGGALLLDVDASLRIHSSASIHGALIRPYGMTFPQVDSSQWASTAIQLMGDDTNVLRSMILGFGQAISGGGVQRPNVSYCKIDCVNGIDLEEVLDIAMLEKIHFWPFATIATVNKPSNWSDRNGAAVRLHNTVDWANVLDVFAYNYDYGVILSGVAQATVANFKTDGPFTVARGTGREGTVGILVEDGSQATRIITPQINSAQFSLVVNLPKGPGYCVTVDGGSLNSSGNPLTGPYDGAAVLVQGGDVNLNTRLHYHSNGIRVTNAESVVTGNMHFESIAQDVVCDVPTSNVDLSKATFGAGQVDGQQVVVGTLKAPVLSTANGGLNLPMNAEVVIADAASNFGAISGGYLGRRITVVFQGSQRVYSADTNNHTNIRFAGNADYISQQGSSFDALHDGLQWREVARIS
ncbi:hypothetical protein [Burkholderia gladioli]|uniref:hypothetical protein n=1 Tax=Burkholderia gladioli TaxID=28095 RepID=UPI00163E9713|nr:hypothetical protein [Burkholderia gladioli]